MNKHIVFVSPKVAEFHDKEIKKPNADEVLVKLVRSSISAGTERANLIGDANVSSIHGPGVHFPRYGGYSSSGIVQEVGENVTHVKKGDRVAMSWTTHSQYCTINKNFVHKLLDGVDFAQAALVHIATFPLAAIRKCHTQIGESAIVMGQGVLGILAVQLLKVAGAVPIIAVDPVEAKRKQALRLGADYALDPFDKDFAAKVKEITGGGADVAIEVTGKGAGLDGVLDCMRPRARVALLGCTRDSNFTIDYYRKVHGPGITLVGAHTQARPQNDSSEGWWTERDDAAAIIKMLDKKRLDFNVLIEEVHSPNECSEIYTRLANEPFFPIVQFDWEQIKE